MGYTPYYFMISQGPRSRVRAWLNDVPFYRVYEPDPLNRTGPAIHLLVPGENTFAIEIDEAPPESVVFFELLIDFDHDNPIFRFEWPREAKHLPEEQRTPFRFEARFTPPGELFSPVYLESPREDVPCNGTPELREAVRRVHEALAAGDVDAYCDRLALKASEMERAYPNWPQASAIDMRRDVEGFLNMDVRLRPLDVEEEIHFEPRAGGRLAHARHLGGGTVIDAVSMDKTADGESVRLSMDLTLTRHRGTWKVLY
ncbi:MAG: hypothetical protein QM820_01660 [Minicystis sp.]